MFPQIIDASERIPGSTRRDERRKRTVPLAVVWPCATTRRARPVLARRAGCRVDHRLVGARAPVLVDPEPHRPPMRDAHGIPSPDLLGPSPVRPLRARARRVGGKATRGRQAGRHRTRWQARARRGRPPPSSRPLWPAKQDRGAGSAQPVRRDPPVGAVGHRRVRAAGLAPPAPS